MSVSLDENADAIVDRLTKDFVVGAAVTSVDAETPFIAPQKVINRAALADMSWIVTPTLTLTTTPGEVKDLTVVVNQGMVGRGVFPFYAQFTTMNDPDYWLDTYDSPPAPEALITFMGGCLLDTTNLEFGTGLVNLRNVYNVLRLATGGTAGFEWDGDRYLYQGMYFMAVSQHRIALNERDWSGGDESTGWHSFLPDKYLGECKPTLDPAVTLGAASADGVTYTNITGNAVTYNAIDSVQNFAFNSGTWDWTDGLAPYDNDSTMGLYINCRVIGAYDFPTVVGQIGNATVDILDITERNGNALPGWGMGDYLDFDIGANDSTFGRFPYSAGFVFDRNASGTRVVCGQIKLPFNFCNDVADPYYEPTLVNAKAIDQDQGMFGPDAFLDSAYYYTTLPQDNYGHNVSAAAQDRAAYFTLATHDFAPSETYTVAIANYMVMDNPGSPTVVPQVANQLNKWMGYGRGDVNNDNKIDLADIIYLANWINYSGPGPIPFMFLGNLNGASTGATYDNADVMYLVNYYFADGPCPEGILKNTGKSTDADNW